jgi:plastocyanin
MPWALAAAIGLCAAAPLARGDGVLQGTVRLAPRAGVPRRPHQDPQYRTPALQHARFFDYDHPGTVVVYLEALDGTAVTNAAGTTTVRIVRRAGRLSFEPDLAVVPRHDKVVFANHDDRPHVLYATAAANRFQFLLPGATSTNAQHAVTFAANGPVPVYALDVEYLEGLVFVAGVRHAVLRGAGRFRFPGLPAGPYRLHAWHARLPPFTAEVTITNGAVTTQPVVLSVEHLPEVK